MTKENALQFIPLIQALSEGKTIQRLRSGGKWEDLTGPNFSAPLRFYRIKPPEPREFFVGLHPGINHGCVVSTAINASRERLLANCTSQEIIKVREVLE